MKKFLFFFFLTIFSASAEVGKVVRIAGENTGYLIRASEKVSLNQDTPLELQDEIHSDNSVLVLYLYPGTQISLGKKTSIKLTEHFIDSSEDKLRKSFSIIDLIKGMVRLQVTKEGQEELEQKITADDVAFAVRGTEFEVSYLETSHVDLDVVEGEVEVSSPHVQTFVPEIVKAKQGFRFDRKKRSFGRRKFLLKFRDHPGFGKASQLRKNWRQFKKNQKHVRNRKRKRKGTR